MSEDLYQVKLSNGDLHTDNLTYEKAEELVDDLEKCFEEDYEIHQQFERTDNKEREYINNPEPDGWEDLFPEY